jgi:ParB-like chromosome segregation protein Spo0J
MAKRANLSKTTPPAAAPASTVAQLKADPANRRRHTERNVTMIADALRSIGSARSIVIDEDDQILAGNGVTTAANQIGLTKLRVIESDGDEPA